MTEQRTALILIELRRIGVDLASLPERLVGTGFRASELLDWLRAIPDGVGTDELLRLVDEYARANASRPVEVRWRRELARPAHRYKRERWWPTQSLLDAATDLLMEEWDPFGVRLAGVEREAVAMFAFRFFGPLLAPNGYVDPIADTAEMIASAERDHLALKASPELHRWYLARRLSELVEHYPVPLTAEPSSQSLVDANSAHRSPTISNPANPGMTLRWWPTVEMLDAGIEVFMSEWRPIGMAAGDIPRETLEELVFHFFGPLLAPRGGVDPLTRTSGMIASAERDRLGLRPSPEANRRHLAERLNDIVHRLPVPNPIVPHARAVTVTSTTELARPPALDPEGVCARCHAFGTVARVTMGYPSRSTRFCASCWRELRSTYMSVAAPEPPRTAREQIAFRDRAQDPLRSVESRSWDDAIDFVNLIMTAREDPKERGKITSAMLAELAAEISTEAQKMDGPMPPEIETFIHEFGAP